MERTLRTQFGCLLLMVVFFFCGCSHLGKQSKDTSSSEQTFTEGQAPASSYMDFGDILIPYGLKLDSKASFVIRSSGLTAGVLVLKGRVEPLSLINFFEVNMARDNWQLISSFKPHRTLMLYHKDTRWCVIMVAGGRFSTKVEIWVSPTLDGAASGL